VFYSGGFFRAVFQKAEAHQAFGGDKDKLER